MASRVARGLFGLWIVGAALFVIVVAFVSYSDIKAEFDAAASKPESAASSSFLLEFRRLHPQYNGLSDAQLAETVHKQFYSDMPRDQFEKKLADKIATSNTKIVKFQGKLYEFPGDAVPVIRGSATKALEGTGTDEASKPILDECKAYLEKNR